MRYSISNTAEFGDYHTGPKIINEQTKDQKWAQQWYQEAHGHRYKFNGGRLKYAGPDPGPYQDKYILKNEGAPDDWYDLINFCDVLNNTPVGPALTDAIWPILNIDETCWEIRPEQTRRISTTSRP